MAAETAGPGGEGEESSSTGERLVALSQATRPQGVPDRDLRPNPELAMSPAGHDPSLSRDTALELASTSGGPSGARAGSPEP